MVGSFWFYRLSAKNGYHESITRIALRLASKNRGSITLPGQPIRGPHLF